MPYPPALPPGTRTNATAQADAHPADHNALVAALQSLLDELGTGPKGDSSSLTNRLAGFHVVDGAVRFDGSSWGTMGYKTSRNGDPAQLIPFQVETTVQFSTFGPVTAKMNSGRAYRVEGQIGINSNTGGVSWLFSLYRSDVMTGPTMQFSHSIAIPDVVQVPFAWFAGITGAAQDVTWTLKATCNGVSGNGRIQHLTVMSVTDIGAAVGAGAAVASDGPVVFGDVGEPDVGP